MASEKKTVVLELPPGVVADIIDRDYDHGCLFYYTLCQVCVCVRVYVCVCARARVCMRVGGEGGEGMCMCMCMCERERERCVRKTETACVYIHIY